jgi:hypothetical protein
MTRTSRLPPFCALVVENLSFPSGGPPPVIFNAFSDQIADKDRFPKGGKLAALRIVARLVKLAVKGGISGKWRDNPFNNLQSGQLVAEAGILSPEETKNAFAPRLG